MSINRFADQDGYLYVFDKDCPDKGIQKRTSTSLFVRRDLYTQFEEDGTINVSMEKEYLATLESKAAPIIEKIVRIVRMKRIPKLSLEERRVFIEFFYIQLTRLPERGEMFIEEAKRKVDRNDIGERTWKNARVATLGYLAREENLIEKLAGQSLCFSPIRDPSSAREFVIGNNPSVRLEEDEKIFFSNQALEIWLPLAKDVIVAWSPGKDDILREMKDKDVWNINLRIYSQSSVVAGSSQILIESLVCEGGD